jgi:hypothetical protein
MDLDEKRALATAASEKVRTAIKRLFDAVRQPAVEITVRRQDLELLLAVWRFKKGRGDG